MRFCFLDHIESYEPGRSIRAVKGVSYAEPYLADHFPGAPLMPGAMMLQSAFEAGRWLLRKDRDFPVVDYRMAGFRNAKFSRLMRPGDVLSVEVRIKGTDGASGRVDMRAKGSCGGRKVFSAGFSLIPYAPVTYLESKPDSQLENIRDTQKRLWTLLTASYKSQREC